MSLKRSPSMFLINKIVFNIFIVLTHGPVIWKVVFDCVFSLDASQLSTEKITELLTFFKPML